MSNDSIRGIIDQISSKLGIERKIERPQTIGTHIARLGAAEFRPGSPTSADEETTVARIAAARIETEDGHHGCAGHRLAGSYDGDMEHRIALATMAVLRERGHLRATLTATQERDG